MVQDRPDTAARILEAATRVLVEEGYEALSMRRIGAIVGISQAAIYRHFRDKAELVDRIIEAGYLDMLARVEAASAGHEPVPALIRRIVAAYVGFARERRDLFKAVLLRDVGPARARVDSLGPGVAAARRSFGLLVALLERGVREGSVAPCDLELSAQAFWAAMFGLAARLAIEAEVPEERVRSLVEREAEILAAGLASRKGE